MKTRTIQTASPFRKNLILGIFLLFSLIFNSYKSMACTANFTYTLNSDGKVHFHADETALDTTIVYYWNFGDGTSEQGQGASSLNWTYSQNGIYTVTLIVNAYSNTDTNTSLCSDTVSLSVTVDNIPGTCGLVASFTAQTDSSGQETYTSNSIGAQPTTMYYWDAGDGSPIDSGVNMTTFVHTYPFIGWYYPALQLGNADTCYSNQKGISIHIYNVDSLQPCFRVYYDSNQGDSGNGPGMYWFYGDCSQGYNSNTYFKWNPGDGSPADSGIDMTTYIHNYTQTGIYNATLTIWYTQLPHRPQMKSPEYTKESITQKVYVISPTGIATIPEANGKFTIYPNPSNGQFTISGLQTGMILEMYDYTGKRISTLTAANGSTQLNISNYTNGMYLIRILDKNGNLADEMRIVKTQ